MSKNQNAQVIDVDFGHPDHQPAQNNAQLLLEAVAGGHRYDETSQQTRQRGAKRLGLASLALVGLGTQTAINSAPEHAAVDVVTGSTHAVEAKVGGVLENALVPSPISKDDTYKKYDMTGKGNYKTYVVQPGDTEWGIASATGLDPDHVDRVENQLIEPQLPAGMDAGNLDPGTTIRLPVGSAIGQVPKQ